MFSLSEHPHRRFNALTGQWVLVSPHRTKRPWLGQVEKIAPEQQPTYDPDCYLCPGNSRAGGVHNPKYTSTFVFDNDFAALLADTPRQRLTRRDLIIAEGEPGICRVICFSPRHDLTLARMSEDEIGEVVDVWADEFRGLGGRESVSYVQIFENRGAMMGASNPHPHCQVWATASIPDEPAKEQQRLTSYSDVNGTCLLCDYAELELNEGSRIVLENDGFLALVPFWAVWPFETLVISREHTPDIGALNRVRRRDMACILKRLTAVYDRVFGVSFPYTMGFHQQPTDGTLHPEWHLHAHFYPPLLRSATVRKFMVGYEMLGTPQRDITPESAAARLRELASVQE
ncbi:MAG TPA: UDP-glucose--hexose-1-phosphate uridylyltransferase [Terriglobales bacterium]|nr:UDP-glucose--hexose-1-phosphate uridylyltransferase [Terriglobales bacterium]